MCKGKIYRNVFSIFTPKRVSLGKIVKARHEKSTSHSLFDHSRPAKELRAVDERSKPKNPHQK